MFDDTVAQELRHRPQQQQSQGSALCDSQCWVISMPDHGCLTVKFHLPQRGEGALEVQEVAQKGKPTTAEFLNRLGEREGRRLQRLLWCILLWFP